MATWLTTVNEERWKPESMSLCALFSCLPQMMGKEATPYLIQQRTHTWNLKRMKNILGLNTEIWGFITETGSLANVQFFCWYVLFCFSLEAMIAWGYHWVLWVRRRKPRGKEKNYSANGQMEYAMLEIKPRAWSMFGKRFTTELHPQLQEMFGIGL
jgi:hypothetical protein